MSNSTGFCLDVPNSAADIGLQVQIFGCNGSFAQEIFISQR
ncbi:MAG: hypothetical protein ABSB59_30155 [Streptosporangiaceae bacterium]